MAELLPGSAELRACLIDIMKKPEWTFHQNDIALEAQRIYAEQFGGDVKALEALEESWKQADPMAPFAGLAGMQIRRLHASTV